GLGTAVVDGVLHRLVGEKRITQGEFRPDATGSEWCDTEVLRRLRRRSLAAARHDVEPVSTSTLGRFLPDWHHLGHGPGGTALYGLDGVAAVTEQLAGVPVPASALEPLILAPRVRDYSPALLDELMSNGEVLWSGAGSISGKDGWVSLHPVDAAPLTLAPPTEIEMSGIHRAILDALAGGGAFFFRQLTDAVCALESSATDSTTASALWDLVWSGHIAGDTLAPLRALIGDTSRATPAHRAPRRAPRARMYRAPRPLLPTRTGPPTVSGRWALLPERETDATIRAHATAELLLD
ncbi:Lhr family ATP-dependent helicase, partial [Rhodococcus chondri]|nr:DEAD/DEAH box helicase [Rhodococcus sp. CC-R104]